jgi:hypothetical protein
MFKWHLLIYLGCAVTVLLMSTRRNIKQAHLAVCVVLALIAGAVLCGSAASQIFVKIDQILTASL